MYAVILASGTSRRFGANKLLTLLDGRPLFSYALENALSCPEIKDITVVTRYAEIEEYVEKTVDILMHDKRKKVRLIHNLSADEGISSSIRLGSEDVIKAEDEYADDRDISEIFSVIYMVADQPFLKKETLQKLAISHNKAVSEDNLPVISVLCFGQTQANPVIFTSHFMGQLLELKGDTGGKAVLKKAVLSGMKFILNKVEASESQELFDIDKKEDMN